MRGYGNDTPYVTLPSPPPTLKPLPPWTQINYEALVDLMCLLAGEHRRQGPGAFLSDWPEAVPYLKRKQSAPGGAVLVFLPGAPEISRLQRALLASERLAEAAGGRQCLRVLPLHGSLSSADQTRVFSRSG